MSAKNWLNTSKPLFHEPVRQELKLWFSDPAKRAGFRRTWTDGKGSGKSWNSAVCCMLADTADRHQLTAVLEPLNHKECNIMNSVRECAAIVEQINHSSLRLLADSYHIAQDKENVADLVEFAPLLAHVHVATGEKRLAPGGEPCPILEQCMDALKKGGYDGRISIEGKINDPETDLPTALRLLRKLS